MGLYSRRTLTSPVTLVRPGSLDRGSMSRAAHQDVHGRVRVPVMGHATATSPVALIQARKPFRAGNYAASVAGLGAPRFVHFLVARAMRNRLVREHQTEGRPGCVVDAFRHLGFGESLGRHIADRDVVKFSDDARRELVQEVPASVADARVDVRGLALLSGSLRLAEFALKLLEMARVVDGLASGQCGEGLQAQVDTDAGLHRSRGGLRYFHDDIQEPVAASVLREVGPVLDLRSSRQIAALEYLVFASMEVKPGRGFSDRSTLNWNPAERALAAPAQVGSLELAPRLGVLLADRVDRVGVQPKFLAAAGRQVVQVKAARPWLAPPDRVLLGFIAEVEHVVHRASLFGKQAKVGLHAVSIDEQHVLIMGRQET